MMGTHPNPNPSRCYCCRSNNRCTPLESTESSSSRHHQRRNEFGRREHKSHTIQKSTALIPNGCMRPKRTRSKSQHTELIRMEISWLRQEKYWRYGVETREGLPPFHTKYDFEETEQTTVIGGGNGRTRMELKTTSRVSPATFNEVLFPPPASI